MTNPTINQLSSALYQLSLITNHSLLFYRLSSTSATVYRLNLHWILRPFGPQDDAFLTTNHFLLPTVYCPLISIFLPKFKKLRLRRPH